MRRSKEDAEQTRIAILAAAEELFARKGVDATSLEHIARAAGVTRGAVYWHFKDKGDLLDALRAQYEPPQHVIVEAALADNHPDIFEVLLTTGPAFLRDFANNPSRQRMFSIVNAALPENRGSADQDSYRMILRLTTLAKDSRILTSEMSPEEAALYLSSFMKGLLTEWLLLEPRFDLVEVGSRLMARHINSLRASA